MDLTQMTINWLSNKRSKTSIGNNVQTSSSNDISFYHLMRIIYNVLL